MALLKLHRLLLSWRNSPFDFNLIYNSEKFNGKNIAMKIQASSLNSLSKN